MVSRTVIAKHYRSQLDRLRAIAIRRIGVEHFGGLRVREHFPIGQLMPLIERTPLRKFGVSTLVVATR
jgi:hypothetical protein